MRSFVVPFDMQEEDKVIGGYISIRQFLWIAISLLPLIILTVINRGYIITQGEHITILKDSLVLRLVIGIICAVFGLIMAFIKKDGINIDTYLLLKFKYKTREKLILFKK